MATIIPSIAEPTIGQPKTSAMTSAVTEEIGNQKPERQEQKVQPVWLGMMIVVQPVLQFAHEGEARRLRMEGEAVKAILADIKRQRANDRPEQRE